MVARGLLNSIQEKSGYLPVYINFSAQTSSARTQEIIESKLEKKRKNILGSDLHLDSTKSFMYYGVEKSVWKLFIYPVLHLSTRAVILHYSHFKNHLHVVSSFTAICWLVHLVKVPSTCVLNRQKLSIMCLTCFLQKRKASLFFRIYKYAHIFNFIFF